MYQTITPMEEFAADINCIIEEAMSSGVSFVEMVGVLTLKVQELGMVSMGMFDADSEDDEEEEV
jgi:hypothetical protein